jgi:hypothetical protein
MVIPNLLLNVNYKETCGQSSVLQHLLTYSFDVGAFPQPLNDISSQIQCMWRGNERMIGLLNLHDDLNKFAKKENYLDLLEYAVADCQDIERNPILQSEFKFCLPASVIPGDLMTNNPEQCMYFAVQHGPMYIYDYNKRFNRENTIIVNEENLQQLNRYYKLEAVSFTNLLVQLSEKISTRKPIQAANFITDKPVAICDMAIEHGLDYTTEEGINTFIKDFLSIEHTLDNFAEMKNVVKVDVDELTTTISSATDYYKYICDSFNISMNLELFNNFHAIFVKADLQQRLKTITRSDFLTDIMCNETDTN